MPHVAFIGGATGYTGRALVPALRARGVEVWAHVRPDSGRLDELRQALTADGAEVDTTAWDEAAMTDRLRQLSPTFVFSLLGTTRKRAKSEGRDAQAAYEAVDYGLTMLLYRATAAGAPQARFVYLSAAGLGDDPSNPYMNVRWRVEQALTAGDTPYTIVRPSFITGPDREGRPMERAGAVVADGLLSVVGALGGRGLAARYKSLTATQLAEGIAREVLQPESAGKILHTEDLR